MAFTVLFAKSRKVRAMKRAALKAVLDSGFEERRRGKKKYSFLVEGSPGNADYLAILESYQRVKSQIERGEVYDFLHMKKKFKRRMHALSKFNRFEILGTLREEEHLYIFKEGEYERVSGEASYKTCPFCNMDVPSAELAEHLKRRCGQDKEEKVTVIFEEGIRTEYEKLVVDSMDVKALKKMIYDRTGVSISRQEVCRGEEILKNGDVLKNETVVLRQKRREQRR